MKKDFYKKVAVESGKNMGLYSLAILIIAGVGWIVFLYLFKMIDYLGDNPLLFIPVGILMIAIAAVINGYDKVNLSKKGCNTKKPKKKKKGGKSNKDGKHKTYNK